MASFGEIAGKSIRLIRLYLKNLSRNSWRRLIILGKQVGICWQNRRLAKQFRQLGESVYAKITAGDVNPLLQDEVKDQLTSLQSLEDNIASRKGAIEQIRQEIKATSYSLAQQPPSAEPEKQTDQPEN